MGEDILLCDGEFYCYDSGLCCSNRSQTVHSYMDWYQIYSVNFLTSVKSAVWNILIYILNSYAHMGLKKVSWKVVKSSHVLIL